MCSVQSKVALLLEGKTVLERSVQPFVNLSIPVVIMLRESDLVYWSGIAELHDNVDLVQGGNSRGASVSRGLEHIRNRYNPDADAVVLVHDAARCLVTEEVIIRVLRKAQQTGAAVPALAVNDTLKRVAHSQMGGSHSNHSPSENESSVGASTVISETVDRNNLFSVQTPQGFSLTLLERAYGSGNLAATDDAGLVEQIAPVSIVQGSPYNIKITRPEDLVLASAFLSVRGEQAQSIR